MSGELIPLMAIISIFIVLPAMIFHYITLWRKQKTLMPDDERMMEDLWRSARAMERRIDTLERLLAAHEEDGPRRPPPSSRSTFDD
ncbi:MAG: envelope stress response membrane protein PspB [Hyphomonas sp.]|nr:envelope stress response membrane protein PspB [Hyphomonas sp.]